MVLGETSAVPVLLKLILDSGLLGWRCTYWADWQERLASLSRSCPRVAASMVRQTFSSPGRHASHVTWGLPSSTPVASSVSAANWRQHFASVGANSHSFDEDFFEEVSQRFRDINSHQVVPGLFDAPFSPSELRRALNLCFDSAVGADGLPYSVFKTNFPWWQSAVLLFFNLVLSWGVVPTLWKRSIVVPVFKRGDPSLATNFRPISLASCCFKIFEHLVHARIGPHISPQLDECQGGFRWGADSLVGSLVDLLSSRSSLHTYVAFIDIHKAFDTSWVEGTLVRLFDAGVSGQMWKLMSHFLRGTQSQVRVGSSLSEPWFDSGIAQGRVLSPLLFNLLVNGLAAAVRRSAPGAQFSPSGVRFPCQLYADDVVLPADSVLDLQTALDAVSEWGRKWRFTFGISPTKSAVMIFGPRSRVPSCAVTLAGSLLPVVNEYTYLGVVLTPSLTWLPHVRHLISRGNRLFAQCVAWCCSDRLSVHFAASLFRSYVLPSISWGLEFCLNSSPAVRLIDGALRRWGRHLLGWPSLPQRCGFP